MIPSEIRLPVLSLAIRPAQVSDADDLSRTCWAERSRASVAEMLRRTEKLAQNRRGLGVVAVCDEEPCAFGLLTLWPRAGEISDLVVSARLRGRGIGSRLIQHLTGAAAELGVRTLEIGAALSNPGALALYRRLGFADSRTIQLDLGQGPEPVLYLIKHLTG